MALRKRFALSTLLLVMLLVSLVFGYAQLRRQWLIGEVGRLKSDGVEMPGLNDNWFWPQLEGQATVTFASQGPDLYSFRGDALTLVQVKEQCRNLTGRIQEIGVTHIAYCMTYGDANGAGKLVTGDLNNLESYVRQFHESLE